MSDELKIGKYTFDVSKQSQFKIEHASKMYNEVHGYKCNPDGSIKTNKDGSFMYEPKNVTVKEIIRIALYLLRQEYVVLKRKNPTIIKAIKDYLKRNMITLGYIKRLSVEEVDEITEWVRYKLTGKKKATENLYKKVDEYLNTITEGMTQEEQSKFEQSFMKSLSELVGKLNT